MSLEQLGNIEVTTVSKEPEEVRQTPAAIFVITQEDIHRSGATSIPEVLRLAPGLDVARIDSNNWAVGVRGFNSEFSKSVLVLIDGRSVYTPLFAGVYWDVQNVMLEDIDRIEVIRGPGGTIWGSNAVNGVINIITKSTKVTHGALATAGGGNVDQGLGAFRYGGGNGNTFDYRIYGMGFTRGPQFHSDSQEFDDWRMAQAGFRLDWSSTERDSITVQGDMYSGAAGKIVSVSAYSPPSITNIQQNADVSGGNLLGRWRHTLGARSDIQVQAYLDRTVRKTADFDEFRNTFDIDLIYHAALPHGHDLIWGAGARFSPSNAPLVVPTVVFAPARFTDKLYSGFLQDEMELVEDRFWLTIGSKFLHDVYSGFEFEPSARLLWTPSHRHSLWTAVTRAVRTPARVDEQLQFTALLLPSLPAFLRLTGDGQFSSEQLLGYEAGYRGLLRDNLFFDLAYFYNSYDDLLSVEAHTPFVELDPPPFHVVLPVLERNGLKGSTTGFEMAPVWTPATWLRLKGSYSFLHMDVKNKPGSVDASSAKSANGSSPEHQVACQALFNLPGNVELDASVRYVSSLPALTVPAYTTADLRLGWRPRTWLEFSITGQNLFQPSHPEFGADQGPLVGIERAVYAKLTWRK